MSRRCDDRQRACAWRRSRRDSRRSSPVIRYRKHLPGGRLRRVRDLAPLQPSYSHEPPWPPRPPPQDRKPSRKELLAGFLDRKMSSRRTGEVRSQELHAGESPLRRISTTNPNPDNNPNRNPNPTIPTLSTNFCPFLHKNCR